MRRWRRVVLAVTGLLVLVLGVGPLVVSLHQDDGYECSGVGGVLTWYRSDRPQEVTSLGHLAQMGQPEQAAEAMSMLVDPCDAVARRQVITAATNVAVVLLIGGLALWFIGRRVKRRGSEEECEPSASDPSTWNNLPTSPPELAE